MRFKPYKKEFDYSYTLGAFPTFELLSHYPDKVLAVFISSELRKNESFDNIFELCANNNIPVETNDKIFRTLSLKENCYIIGVFQKSFRPVQSQNNHVILVNPSDMGNMGTIMRTCRGFGFHDLVIISQGADIFNPKTIRASMGAIFGLSVSFYDEIESYMETHRARELYTFMLDGIKSLKGLSGQITGSYSLVFGNEATGLPPKYKEVGTSVSIRHLNYIDSLNLSVAVGIALYELFSNQTTFFSNLSIANLK